MPELKQDLFRLEFTDVKSGETQVIETDHAEATLETIHDEWDTGYPVFVSREHSFTSTPRRVGTKIEVFIPGQYQVTRTNAEAIKAKREKEIDEAERRGGARALRAAALGFIDWGVVFGHESATPVTERDHKAAEYLERLADELLERVGD